MHCMADRTAARLQLVARERVEHQVHAAPAGAAQHRCLKRARAAVGDVPRRQGWEARQQSVPLRLRTAGRVYLMRMQKISALYLCHTLLTDGGGESMSTQYSRTAAFTRMHARCRCVPPQKRLVSAARPSNAVPCQALFLTPSHHP